MGWTFHRNQASVEIGIPVFLGQPEDPLESRKQNDHDLPSNKEYTQTAISND